MSRVAIKICEFETLDVSVEASYMDIQAMGFHIFEHHDLSKRLRQFKKIFPHLSEGPKKVILTDRGFDDIIIMSEKLHPDILQISTAAGPGTYEELRNKIEGMALNTDLMKVVSSDESEREFRDESTYLSNFESVVDLFLLDTNLRGGTGRTHNWSKAREFISRTKVPVFLAGGLNAKNVGPAIRECRPSGVDVETGVSRRLENGILVKNILKIDEFIKSVRSVERAL